MFKPLPLFIGTRYTNFKRRDQFITFISIVSILGIAIGVMVLITVLSVMNGFTKEIRERILNITPHIIITSKSGTLENWEKIAKEVSQFKEIENTGPYIEGQGMFTQRNGIIGAEIKGIDPKTVEAIFPIEDTLIQGNIQNLRAGEYGVILGINLAKQLGLHVGDNITFMIPQISVSLVGVSPRLKRLTVVGIFKAGYIYDSNLAFLNIDDAGRIFKTHGKATGLQIKLNDPFLAPSVSQKLSATLPNDYEITDWTVLNKVYFSSLKMQKTMMFFTLIMILAIAVFNLISTLVMIVTEKRSDIGLLRSLGASRVKIMSIFVSQGTIIGFFGTLLGVIAGIALALNVTDLVAYLEELLRVKLFATDMYFLSFLPSHLQQSDILFIAICALLLSFLATIQPAWRAANVKAAEALRHD